MTRCSAMLLILWDDSRPLVQYTYICTGNGDVISWWCGILIYYTMKTEFCPVTTTSSGRYSHLKGYIRSRPSWLTLSKAHFQLLLGLFSRFLTIFIQLSLLGLTGRRQGVGINCNAKVAIRVTVAARFALAKRADRADQFWIIKYLGSPQPARSAAAKPC